jgi:hypothetical protein
MPNQRKPSFSFSSIWFLVDASQLTPAGKTHEILKTEKRRKKSWLQNNKADSVKNTCTKVILSKFITIFSIYGTKRFCYT